MQILAMLTAGLIAIGLSAPAVAQDSAAEWPSKVVTVIVPFGAGGNTDILARIASQKLSERFGQNFIVENRVGAGGIVAATAVAKADPNGYTLFFAATPQFAIMPNIRSVPYDPAKDFVPVSVFTNGPFILAVNADRPAKSIPDLVRLSKDRTLNHASGGAGTVAHLTGDLFLSRAGLKGQHITYRGGGDAVTALLRGDLDFYFGNASELMPLADTGKITILGVSTSKRMKALPNVPTIAEFYPNFEMSTWNGFLAPAKTPKAIVDKLAAAIGAAARDPAVVERLQTLGVEAAGTTSEEMVAQMAREQPLFDAAIDAAGLKQSEK
jgi:tripartite-type tricarboxylate transporter receptor subunit TctC